MISGKEENKVEILFDTTNSPKVRMKHRMDTDEEIVRHELVRVWTKLLETYARPGMQIPPAWVVRQEILSKGVDAAVEAMIDEHWFMFSWMVRDEIREKVERGLNKFDLEQFIKDVRLAQSDPRMLQHLKEEIRNHVLFEDFD